jgi:hypothetical protein
MENRSGFFSESARNEGLRNARGGRKNTVFTAFEPVPARLGELGMSVALVIDDAAA